MIPTVKLEGHERSNICFADFLDSAVGGMCMSGVVVGGLHPGFSQWSW